MYYDGDKFQKQIERYMEQFRMLEGADCVIAGVSGGADSVCLLLVLNEIRKKLDISLIVLHVNHGIRGEEALRDEVFVRELCRNLNVEYVCVHVDVPGYAKEHRLSEEEAGRELRYRALYERKTKHGKIAVAHNADDQAETVLFHLCRGCGVKGLGGIAPVSGDIIRPLLETTRAEIEEYLKERGQEYITDSTNLSIDYTRNRIRHNILPVLEEEIHRGAAAHIASAARMAREAEDYLESLTKERFEAAQKKAAGQSETGEWNHSRIVLDRDYLRNENPYMRKRILRRAVEQVAGRLKDIAKVHIEQLESLLLNQTGKCVQLPYSVLARNEYSVMVLEHTSENVSRDKKIFQPLNVDIMGEYICGEKKFIFEELFFANEEEMKEFLDKNIKNLKNMCTKCFDYDKLKNTVQIRNRVSGDYICVDEMGKKKKLKDYFIDEKVPRELRDEVIVLADGNEILWIVGYRTGERCKLTKDTRRVLRVTVTGKTATGK